MKSVLKKLNIFNYIEILLIIITLVLYIFPLKNDYNATDVYNGEPTPYLTENTHLEALFISSVDELDSIGIPFATYMHENTHGILKLEIYNDDKIILKELINVKNITDNSTYIAKFPIQKNSRNKKFKIVLSFDEYYDDIFLVSLFSPSNGAENVFINDVPYEKNLYISQGGKIKNKFYSWYPLLMLFIIFSLENTMIRGKK